MNTNCSNCDKPDCPYKAAREAFDNYPLILAVSSNPEWKAVSDAMWAAHAVCERNQVNWRDRCLAAEAEIATVNRIAEMERVFPVLEGLTNLLVEVDRTGRPASARLICRVVGTDGDEDLPMVSVWATSGDGNPVDRCVELAEKLAAAEAELAKLRERVADTTREARLIVSQSDSKDAYRQGAAAASKNLLARLEVLP